MTFRPHTEHLCINENKEGVSYKDTQAPIDWRKDSYIDRVGTLQMLNGAGYTRDCVEKLAPGFPSADEVLSISTCIKDKKALAEIKIGQHEAETVLNSLPGKLKEAAANNEKHVVVMTFNSPSLPHNYLDLVNTLHEKGYKTGFVHALNGEEVPAGRPVPGMQLYHLIAKFDK